MGPSRGNVKGKAKGKGKGKPSKGGRGHIREIDAEQADDPYAGWDYYDETQDEQWEYDPAEEEWEDDTSASSGVYPLGLEWPGIQGWRFPGGVYTHHTTQTVESY